MEVAVVVILGFCLPWSWAFLRSASASPQRTSPTDIQCSFFFFATEGSPQAEMNENNSLLSGAVGPRIPLFVKTI